MSLEASGLKVVVESHGIASATDALNKLAVAGDKAEKSTAKLAKANKGAEASAKQQEKLWYDLLQKSAKFYEQQYNAQQRHNNRLYGLVQAEANKMNRIYDRQVAQDAASFAKRRAQEQSQLEALDTMRHKAAAKEYARAQAEATRMNALLDRQRKQQEAAAKASAERQRVLNSNYSSSSLAQQIATLQRAQQYGSQGGNISQRFGSQVAGASSSGELERLQRQYRQLDMEARRANRTMADTHAAVRGLSGSLGALWLTYGNLLPLIAGAAVGMAIKGIISTGADIEHTLEKIRVLGQATTGEIDLMRKAVFDLGTGVQGPKDVAQALSVLTLAGLDAKEAMQGVAATLNLAVAGDVSIEKASSTLVQISTSLGYTAADFGHLADVVAKTAAASMSSVDSISGAFLSAAAVGEIYGASLKDIGVGLAAVANLGIQGTAAGTTLKNFYADLVKGTEKSTKALKTMGLTMRDLKDDNGAMLDIVTLVTKLNDGLSKVNAQARTTTQDNAFGERGVKTFAALNKLVNTASTEIDQFGNVYKNKLTELAGEIERSAAFATTAALAMSQTATNQMKSVGNTLQVTLAKAFESIAPQIGQVARALKAAFASPEFLNGIKFIGTAIANLTVFVVEHGKQIAIMIAAYAGWKVGVFAAGIISMARGFDIAKIAARGFTAALGPLGLAITALSVAWELYASKKNKAISDNDANAGSLDEYAKGVAEAAKNEEKSLQMRLAGISEMEVARAEEIRNSKAASQKLITASAENVTAWKKSLDEQYNALSENEKKRVAMIQRGETNFGSRNSTDYIDNVVKYNAALEKHNKTVGNVLADEQRLFTARSKNGKMAEEAAKKGWIKPTGDVDITSPEAEKAAAKAVKFAANEALEMKKNTASYEAKNEAMREAIRLGQHIMADTKQAIVLENLKDGKYGGNRTESNAVYQEQKKLALAEDIAKAENERLKKQNEFSNKLAGLEAAQAEYNRTAIDGSMTHFGALRKEAEEVIKLNSLYGEAADKLRMRADAMDVYKRQQEDIAKLEKAADSANARAGAADDEAENMLKFGVRAKATAMQLAELYIQKMKLDTAGSLVATNMLREAAATEQLSDAYRDLIKEQLDLEYDLEKAQADSLAMFGQNEMEKVRILADSQKKQAALKMAAAEEAFDTKGRNGTLGLGDVNKIMAAREAYEKTLKTIGKIADIKMGDILTKDEIDRWKDFANTIENALTGAFGKAGEAAGKMFGLLGQNQARELTVAKQISAIQESNYLTKEEKEREIDRLQHKSATDRIGEYAGMADAAKGFFDEGSRGYNAMTKASKVLHAAEVALSLIKGVNAVLTQGSGDPYSAFARMAAMAALVAGLGVAISGGGGGMSSKDKQSVQGTGSVLGSSTVTKGNKVELVGAKSESIKNSLDILQRNSNLGLVKQDGLLNAMRSLSNSISKLAVMVVRDTDLSGSTLPTQEVFNSKGIAIGGGLAGGVAGAASGAYLGMGAGTLGAIFGGPLGMALGAAIGAIIGKTFIGKALGSILGGKITNEDIGFTIDKTTLGGVNTKGVEAFQYAQMKKDGGWFRSDKTWTDKTSVGNDLNSQFTKIFQGMGEALVAAADIVGVGGEDFISKLNSFVIDIGEISLKGLTGEEIEKELQSVISKVGDQMAQFAFADFQQYQKIGEGMLETVARVANELLQVRDVFTVLGKSLPNGMAAVAMTQKIVEAFGSVENLTSGVSDYMQNILTEEQRLAITTKSVTDAMVGMGLASVTTRDQFKAVVDGLDLTKDADIALFRSLMGLSAQFGKVVDAADAATKAEKERAENLMSQRLELEGRVAELTNDSAEAARVLAAQRAIELSKLDASLQPLQTRVWMLEDEAVASEKAAALANSRLDLESQIANLTKDTAMASSVLAAQRAIELTKMDESLRLLQTRVWMLEDEADALQKAEAILTTRLGLESQIAELTKDTAMASRILSAQRAIELSKMDESLRPLQTRVWALEDEATAAEKAAEASKKNKEAIDAAITRADEAFSRLSDSIAKEKEIVSKIYDEAIESVRKKAEAEKTSAQEMLDQAEVQKSAIKSVFDALTSALKSTQVESVALTKARRVEAQSYLQVAAIQAKSGGDITKLPGLDNALEMIAKPSEELFSTFEEYARDQALTANVIGSLQGTAQTQLSAAELTIERLNATIEAIDKNAAATIEGFEKARDAELSNLDNMLEKAQQQIDAVKGVDNSVQSLTQAIMGFAASVAGVTATQIQQTQGTDAAIQSLYQNLLGRNVDTEGSAFYSDKVKNGVPITSVADAIKNSTEYTTKVIEQMYRNVFNREADAGGLAFYQDALKRGASLFDIEQSFKTSAEYKAMKGLPSFDVGTNFVPQDMVAQIHKGERIIPAADNAAIMRSLNSENSSSEAESLKQEIRDLKNALITGDVAQIQTDKELLRLLKKWDQEGQPEIRNVELQGN